MSEKNTVVRALHDIGLAAWFGGSLMGAVGLNGAAGDVSDPTERARIASSGWARWTPVNAGAIGLHLAGGLALLAVNRDRVRHQPGVAASSAAEMRIASIPDSRTSAMPSPSGRKTSAIRRSGRDARTLSRASARERTVPVTAKPG